MSLLDFRSGKLAQHVFKKHRRLKSIAFIYLGLLKIFTKKAD
jgi:hypothetical protein